MWIDKWGENPYWFKHKIFLSFWDAEERIKLDVKRDIQWAYDVLECLQGYYSNKKNKDAKIQWKHLYYEKISKRMYKTNFLHVRANPRQFVSRWLR